MERKLAAILSADVKGYSRLMSGDEEATIRTLKTYREVITSLIERHHGRVVDSPGDNMLAEFASAVDAVKSTVAIQRELKARNAELETHRRMEFRIGLNMGDVITDEGRLYGDGVNIAARLEALADAGGICISGKVFDEVKTKLKLGYTSIGAQQVKNIAEPVLVYKVELDLEGTAPPTASLKPHAPIPLQATGPSRRWPLATLAVAAVLVVGAAVMVWQDFPDSPSSPQQSMPSENASALPLPDKPSIAVLPFTNMSGDPEQEYFSDGMTDTLITELSRLSGLFVIARNSVFTYKGKAVKVEEVSRELGVRYVLEGSVQKADGRVRINAQLIDTGTGGHVWAERYDQELHDIFTVQDDIVRKIVTTLDLQLTLWEQGHLLRRTTDNLEAYDYFLRGKEYFFRFTQDANLQAQEMWERAVELDPQYAWAYVGLGWARFRLWYYQWGYAPQGREEALQLAQKAIALDDALGAAHALLGYIYLWTKQHGQAIAELEQAVSLDPSYATNYTALAQTLNYAGKPKEAIELLENIMHLDPRHPAPYLHELGVAYYLTGQEEGAIATLQRALTFTPDWLWVRLSLAAIYGDLGREEEARAEGAEILRISPAFSLEVWEQRVPFADPALTERWVAALRKAGLK